MNTASNPNIAVAIAAPDQAKAAAVPRIKLSSHGFCIDHPDPELGEQLMADAMGVTDRDAMHGILKQLVKASVSGEKSDEINLSFMISMVKNIKPRDSVEAMLVAQMVCVHVMAMRCAYHLANAEDIAQQDSAGRILGRLARTFPAQIEALNRCRSNGEPAITMQTVSVQDGGKAIVGNVMQHASVILSDMSPAPEVTAARMVPMPELRNASTNPRTPSGEQSRERSRPQYRPDAGEPALRGKNPFRRRVPLAAGARQEALPHARRRAGIRRAKGEP
jgi:hypothetical protein